MAHVSFFSFSFCSRDAKERTEVQKNFVTVIRTVESALLRRRPYSNNAEALTIIAIESPITLEVRSAILASIPLLSKMEFQFDNAHREPLITMSVIQPNLENYLTRSRFMDINWQNTNPPNPADAKIGPQVYDNHLYYRCVFISYFDLCVNNKTI